MADYGIKISEEGYDVKTCDDVNLILKSSFTLLKVVFSGTIDLSTGSNTVTHGLGYIPQFLVFGLADGGGGDDYILPANGNTYWYPNDFTTGDYIRVEADTTKLYFSVGSAHGTSIESAYCYIFYEGM